AAEAARGSSNCSRRLIRWSTARRAERGPRPGTRASSCTSRSTSGPAMRLLMERTSTERQRHPGRRRPAGCQFGGLFLDRRLGARPGLVVGGKNQILENLDLVLLEQRRVDLQLLHLALARQGDRNEPATGLAGDLHGGDLLLELLHLLLH